MMKQGQTVQECDNGGEHQLRDIRGRNADMGKL
jgi:hypothetical protein